MKTLLFILASTLVTVSAHAQQTNITVEPFKIAVSIENMRIDSLSGRLVCSWVYADGYGAKGVLKSFDLLLNDLGNGQIEIVNLETITLSGNAPENSKFYSCGIKVDNVIGTRLSDGFSFNRSLELKPMLLNVSNNDFVISNEEMQSAAVGKVMKLRSLHPNVCHFLVLVWKGSNLDYSDTCDKQ